MRSVFQREDAHGVLKVRRSCPCFGRRGGGRHRRQREGQRPSCPGSGRGKTGTRRGRRRPTRLTLPSDRKRPQDRAEAGAATGGSGRGSKQRPKTVQNGGPKQFGRLNFKMQQRCVWLCGQSPQAPEQFSNFRKLDLAPAGSSGYYNRVAFFEERNATSIQRLPADRLPESR